MKYTYEVIFQDKHGVLRTEPLSYSQTIEGAKEDAKKFWVDSKDYFDFEWIRLVKKIQELPVKIWQEEEDSKSEDTKLLEQIFEMAKDSEDAREFNMDIIEMAKKRDKK